MRDIQVFLGFVNFYWRFIQSFSRIAKSFISILKTSSTTQSTENLSQINVAEDAEVGGDGGGNYEERMIKRSLSKNLNGAGYLTPNAKKTFNHLWGAFTKALIFQHFDPERHIRIKSNALGYAIGGVLSQLILDNLGQWHLVAYFSQKMILAKTRDKTHNGELLAIVKVFKT